MIKVKVNNEYKDIVGVFGGGTLQKEIIKIWSREAGTYVYESSVEYTGSLPITINANGEALIDYRIYGASGGVGEQTESGEPAGYKLPMVTRSENLWSADKVTQIQVTSDASVVRYGIAFSGSAFSLCIISNSIMYYKIKTGDTYEDANQLSVGMAETITLTDNQTLLVYGGNLALVQQAVIQINSGSTILHYEPYSRTDTPIYIGENLLGKDEYVDYGEGKIYRKNPANYFDGYFELGAINYNTGAETPTDSAIRTDFIELEPSNRYWFKWATGNLYIIPVSYDENKNYVRYLGAKSTNPSYFNLGANEKYIRFYLYNTTTPPMEMMVCKNANAPYLQPTKTPVPLPDIPTIKGETVIDYGGDPKPSQMYVKYRR